MKYRIREGFVFYHPTKGACHPGTIVELGNSWLDQKAIKHQAFRLELVVEDKAPRKKTKKNTK